MSLNDCVEYSAIAKDTVEVEGRQDFSCPESAEGNLNQVLADD